MKCGSVVVLPCGYVVTFMRILNERMIRAALDPVPNWLQIARISSRDTNELLRHEYHVKDKVGRPEHHALHDAHALAYSYRPRSTILGFVNPLAL